MKEIDLEKILQNYFSRHTSDIPNLEGIKFAMHEACKQVLELASENARTMDDPNSYCGNTGSEYPPDIIVNKQSILNTIKQVK